MKSTEKLTLLSFSVWTPVAAPASWIPGVRATQYSVLVGSVTVFILAGGRFLKVVNGARNLLTQNLKVEPERFFFFFFPEERNLLKIPVTEVCN